MLILIPLLLLTISLLLARLVTLLQRVPLSLVDRKALLPLAEKNGFFRAAVILLKSASGRFASSPPYVYCCSIYFCYINAFLERGNSVFFPRRSRRVQVGVVGAGLGAGVCSRLKCL